MWCFRFYFIQNTQNFADCVNVAVPRITHALPCLIHLTYLRLAALSQYSVSVFLLLLNRNLLSNWKVMHKEILLHSATMQVYLQINIYERTTKYKDYIFLQ